MSSLTLGVGARNRLVAIMAILACVAMPARAEIATSRSGSSSYRSASEEESWWTFRQLGPCLARSKKAKAVAFVSAPEGSPDEAAAFKALFSGANGCLRNMRSMTAARAVIKGAVADGLYRTEFGNAPTAPHAGGATISVGAIRSVGDFASCYARSHPSSIHGLIMGSPLGSLEEQRAVAQLAPEFGYCLPQGVSLAVNATEMRMKLVEALYLASIPPVGPQAMVKR